MKLVVGLGNPGRRYAATRHNIGFEVIAELYRRHGGGRPKSRFSGEWVESRIDGQVVLLLCPLTYMNASGRSVQAAVQFYKLPLDSLLVICDDFQLPLGRLRFRPSGSAGGQKGLADIIRHLGTDQVPRLRIGIGTPPDRVDPADFVLSRFDPAERGQVEGMLSRAADGAETWVRQGIQIAMNQYNAEPEARQASGRPADRREPDQSGRSGADSQSAAAARDTPKGCCTGAPQTGQTGEENGA